MSIREPIRHGPVLEVVLELVRCQLDRVEVAYSLWLLDVRLLNFSNLDPESIHLELRTLDCIHDSKTASRSLLTVLGIEVSLHGLDFLIGASSPSWVLCYWVWLSERVQIACLTLCALHGSILG